ncbi:MAG TPA: regulatory protein RecX [Gemmatimonadaceae bacterium]|nr:regulatory protein RecX [Gemmatimonadaceae bacterium]
MAVISAIVPDPRRPGRVDVAVDGKSMGAVPVEALVSLGLRVGAPFEPVRAAFEAERARLGTWDRATGLLAARARSRMELRRLLVRKGEPADQVDRALDRLEAAGYLDDADFARQFARSKALGGGMSRRRLQQELARRGVDRSIAEPAIAEVYAEEEVSELDAAERLARKKMRSLARYDEATRRRRLYGYLARRGFEGEEIREILARIEGETAD